MADDSQLIESLYELSNKSRRLVKFSDYAAPADKNITITSWKMDEFKYYNVPSPFPTLARGLFTTENRDDTFDIDVQYRIVARGYDKFFNIGEVPWTNWWAIERHTIAPYTLTLKSNGCIIFIAALTPEKLLITSKHSIGPVAGVDESHAEVGERWLLKHLEKSGKTTKELAKTLWDKRWTAVAELCDDSFEEHVLPIPSDMTGLHLHGLNSNTRNFHTQAQPVVDAFAEEWGFIKTASIVLQTEREVREFTQEVGKTGKWNDVAVEGFVVRTTIGPRPVDVQSDTPPYPPGSSFFFKVKFDEPYMMYRDWREITKALLSAKAKGKMSEAKISKAKLRRKETVVYKSWVEREITRNPSAFATYGKNIGIIAVRDSFFKWLETPEGKEQAGRVNVDVPPQDRELDIEANKARKVVIVPIAIPGSGKTTIAVALKHLFPFGHTQSDDIMTKKPAPAFHSNVAELLKNYDVVIADRNNHRTQHREGIREAVSKFKPRPRLIALDWNIKNVTPATAHRIVTDRIVARGANHQSLIPEEAEHEEVVWRFLREFDELAEGEVDDVIEMEIDESLEDSLTRAVTGIVDLLGESNGLEKPTDEEMGEALSLAYTYEPIRKKKVKKESKKEMENQEEGSKKKKDKAGFRYYALLPEIDLAVVIEQALISNEPIPESVQLMWEHLKAKSRIAQRPHVTITHMKERENEGAVWSACEKLSEQGKPPSFEFDLGHLVWNDRVMALSVENVRVTETDGGGEEAADAFLRKLPEKIRNRLHVTVGTYEPSIPPVEAKDLVANWRSGAKEGEGTGTVAAIPLRGVTAQGRIKGLSN